MSNSAAGGRLVIKKLLLLSVVTSVPLPGTKPFNPYSIDQLVSPNEEASHDSSIPLSVRLL